MQLIRTLAACALLLSASGMAAAANSTRIAETGAYLLGNAHRCGVADDRVIRAGKVIRELIVAASDDDERAEGCKVPLCRNLPRERPGRRRRQQPQSRLARRWLPNSSASSTFTSVPGADETSAGPPQRDVS